MSKQKIAVGMMVRLPRLGAATIIAIHAAGTIDVEAPDGRCFRISGLSFSV